MIQLRHIGLFVEDIKKMQFFYENVFDFILISETIQKDSFVDEILNLQDEQIKEKGLHIVKLITPYGKTTGAGDMLELLEAKNSSKENTDVLSDVVNKNVMHICLSVDNIDTVVDKALVYGAKKRTNIHVMDNGSKVCYIKDPEGNYLELIQRK